MAPFKMLAAIAAVSSGATETPCCQTCPDGKEKYFSIPNPGSADDECGECCLRPSLYKIWKLFEPKLLKGNCLSQGYTQYKSTETDGVPPLAVTNDRYVRANEPDGDKSCPPKLHAVYADMHDGDKKEVSLVGSALTIKPSGNNQTWVVHSQLDKKTCSASVDFNVPGKPSPPPVNITLSLWYSLSSKKQKKSEFEFTDPSGKLPAGPLNRWVELGGASDGKQTTCVSSLKAVYADMHDGDKKEITISGTSISIRPSGNNQTWVVHSKVEPTACTAAIDFRVPGKPNPPPTSLQATLLTTYRPGMSTSSITEIEFTDPSGKLAAADFPLNHWVEIKRASPEDNVVQV